MKLNKLSSSKFKFMMNLYPPFFFNRIRIKEVSQDFQEIKIVLKKSIFNINGSGTIFGGALFAAADPFFPLMYLQIFGNQLSTDVQVWTKSAHIQFKKPVLENVFLNFIISNQDIEEAKKALNELGKHNKTHSVELKNKAGEVCAVVDIVTYIGIPDETKS